MKKTVSSLLAATVLACGVTALAAPQVEMGKYMERQPTVPAVADHMATVTVPMGKYMDLQAATYRVPMGKYMEGAVSPVAAAGPSVTEGDSVLADFTGALTAEYRSAAARVLRAYYATPVAAEAALQKHLDQYYGERAFVVKAIPLGDGMYRYEVYAGVNYLEHRVPLRKRGM